MVMQISLITAAHDPSHTNIYSGNFLGSRRRFALPRLVEPNTPTFGEAPIVGEEVIICLIIWPQRHFLLLLPVTFFGMLEWSMMIQYVDELLQIEISRRATIIWYREHYSCKSPSTLKCSFSYTSNQSLSFIRLLHNPIGLGYKVAPTSFAYASVLNDLGRSIGAPTARSMISWGRTPMARETPKRTV